MLRKIALFLFGCTVLTAIVAVGLMMMMMMMMGSPQSEINQVALVSLITCVALLIVGCRTQKKSAPKVVYAERNMPAMQHFGTGPNNRPVMTYKGQVYDFVHNDPTAPDPA